jgi:ribosomal protein L14E/L6E/L27E
MEEQDLNLGQVVCSLAGRDKGHLFLVIEKVDVRHVIISDGKYRKVDKGKKKKVKHLKKTNYIVYELQKSLEEHKTISDAQIRRYLKDYQQSL